MKNANLMCQIKSLEQKKNELELLNDSNDCEFTKFLLDTGNELFSNYVTEGTVGYKILEKITNLYGELNMSTKKTSFYSLICMSLELQHNGKPLEFHSYYRTRWVSAIDSLNRILRLKPARNKEFETKFDDDDFIVAEKLLKLLIPFRELCEILSSNYCTVKYVLPLLVQYRKKMVHENICLVNQTTGIRTTNLLIDFIKKIVKYYERYAKNNILLLSSYLDINFIHKPFWNDFINEENKTNQNVELSDLLSKYFAELLIPYLNMSFKILNTASIPVEESLDSNTIYNDLGGDEPSFEIGDQSLDMEFITKPEGNATEQFNKNFDRISIKGDLINILKGELVTYRQFISQKRGCLFQEIIERRVSQSNKLVKGILK